jgi:hypothetical protein
VSRWSRRIARLKNERRAGTHAFRLLDGTVKHIRTKNLLDAACQAIDGLDTPGARLLLTADSCLTGGCRLHEAIQALSEGPTIQYQPTQKEKTQ